MNSIIKYETIDELVQKYMSNNAGKFSGVLSEQSSVTVVDLLETLVALLNEGRKLSQITVKILAERSGYSRTTFYKYFYDIKHMLEVLEDMLDFHTKENYETYMLMFQNALSKEDMEKLKQSMIYYYPYINICFEHNPKLYHKSRSFFTEIFSSWLREHFKNEDDLEYYMTIYSRMYVDTYLYLMQHPTSKIWDSFFSESIRIMQIAK